MTQKFQFLFGYFNSKYFVYAIKLNQHCWHYFQMLDSISYEHVTLPPGWKDTINCMTGIHVVELILNEEQAAAYFKNRRLVFKDKQLKTCKFTGC